MTELLDAIGRMHNHLQECRFTRFGVKKPKEPRVIDGREMRVFRLVYQNPSSYRAPPMGKEADRHDLLEPFRRQLESQYPNLFIQHHSGVQHSEDYTSIDFTDRTDPTLSSVNNLDVLKRVGVR